MGLIEWASGYRVRAPPVFNFFYKKLDKFILWSLQIIIVKIFGFLHKLFLQFSIRSLPCAIWIRWYFRIDTIIIRGVSWASKCVFVRWCIGTLKRNRGDIFIGAIWWYRWEVFIEFLVRLIRWKLMRGIVWHWPDEVINQLKTCRGYAKWILGIIGCIVWHIHRSIGFIWDICNMRTTVW